MEQSTQQRQVLVPQAAACEDRGLRDQVFGARQN